MSFVNIIDGSTTVSASTAGMTVDLRGHTTKRLASVGVPVRFEVCVYSGAASDTGAVKLLDSNGATVLTCLVNNPAATTSDVGDWYWVNGYLPATLAKYDVHHGGNILGGLTTYSASVYELDWSTDAISGAMSSSIGNIGLTADGHASLQGSMSATMDPITLVADGHATLSGDLNQSIGTIALSAAGTVEISGTLSQSIGNVTLLGTGTVASVTPPAFGSAGTGASGTGALTPGIPGSTVANDILILVCNAESASKSTLTTANGFAEITSLGAGGSQFGTLFWKRAAGSDSSPVVAANGNQACKIYRFTGCITSGNPWDITSSTADTDHNASFSVAGATTTVNGTLVAVFALGDLTVGTVTISGWTNADLASVTEQDDSGFVVSSSNMSIALATGTKTTTGAYTSTTATWSNSAFFAVGFTVALKPPP